MENIMWFKNALVYQVENMPDVETFEKTLSEHVIKPCPPHSRYIYGWVETLNTKMSHSVNGQTLFVMGKEERILPPSVINQMIDEKIATIEAEEGRVVRRSERNQMKEEFEFSLLPKSFSVLKKTWGYYDKKNRYLIINTSSVTLAGQFCALLRKSFEDIVIMPVELDMDINERLTQCVKQPFTLPKQFDLGERVVLQDPDDEKKRLTCKGYELPADEVLDLLSRGLKSTELSFHYNERLDFTLNHQLVIKNIKCRDLLLDELKASQRTETKEEEFDSSFILMSSEINQLIDAILSDLLALKGHYTVDKEGMNVVSMQQ